MAVSADVDVPGGAAQAPLKTFMASSRIFITGIVQGVGFRPFVYNLARDLNLTGWVKNTSAGVEIAVDGPASDLDLFLIRLQKEKPPLSLIERLSVDKGEVTGLDVFEIQASSSIEHAFQPVSADVSTCPDCLAEIYTLGERRYHYPFTNCTNCGPRFTIITDIPYDRPNTTMAGFQLCPVCLAEYQDPTDRRFHAQPIACPRCGPHVWYETLEQADHPMRDDAAIKYFRQMIREGRILAIKGLGGFHIACDATESATVLELRRRKLRVDKPFAVMMANLEMVAEHCYLSHAEMEALAARERPIVILRRKSDSTVVPGTAPGQESLGVMLPYTPLHHLIFRGGDRFGCDPDEKIEFPLVMTSGNLSEEPIATENDEARLRLASLVDGYLMHNRPIRTRCDDSVIRIFDYISPPAPKEDLPPQKKWAIPLQVRRSRGYAPIPLLLPWDLPPILAVGAELKNTFCLTRQNYAFLSHHIGDMENYETLRSFEDSIDHFERLFRIQPQAYAYDLHPNYLASRYVLDRAEREQTLAYGIQHHHAHIAACMAEHELPASQPVIGFSFDGTGYGLDGAVWGGEVLVSTYKGFRRFAHLSYAPLPGGDQAIKAPWRMALAWLRQAGIPWDSDLPPVRFAGSAQREGFSELDVLEHQLIQRINTPLTSSLGRLFDAVAALAGVRQAVNYEAQAAIELEACLDPGEFGSYPVSIYAAGEGDLIFDPGPLLSDIVRDVRDMVSLPVISARFHNTLARVVVELATKAYQVTSIRDMILSGGVWQNMSLLQKVVPALESAGFTVYYHQKVPTNDGGLALGQALVAAANIGELR